MKESMCDVIDLHDTPPEAFRIILEYMYSGMVGKVELQVNSWMYMSHGCFQEKDLEPPPS